MKVTAAFPLLFAAVASMLFPGVAFSQQEEADIIVYSGYFSRQGNNGKMAEISGYSHYVKFYPNNRIIRLFIPYPYSKGITPDVIREVFSTVNRETTGSAYIRDTFGLLDKPVVAHLDVVRRVDGQIMFDCGDATPCTIEFPDDSMQVIKRGVVKDHVMDYVHIKN